MVIMIKIFYKYNIFEPTFSFYKDFPANVVFSSLFKQVGWVLEEGEGGREGEGREWQLNQHTTILVSLSVPSVHLL